MNTKVDEIYPAVTELEFDVVVLTETWLKEDTHSDEFFPDDYQVYRRDRRVEVLDLCSGGGVLIAIDRNINSVLIDTSYFDDNFPAIDFICCKAHICGTVIFFLALYVPPQVSLYDFDLFFEALEQWSPIADEKVVMLGDFNAPRYNLNDVSDGKTRTLNNFLSYFNATQYNNVLNSHQRLLDLVISNVECQVESDENPLVLIDAYHPALKIQLKKFALIQNNLEPNKQQRVYNFKKCDFPILYRALTDTDWLFLRNSNNINQAVDVFYERLYGVLDKHVPLYRNFKRKFPQWYNSSIIKNIKAKEKYHSKWKETHEQCYKEEFRRLRTLTKQQIKMAYNQYIRRLLNGGRSWHTKYPTTPNVTNVMMLARTEKGASSFRFLMQMMARNGTKMARKNHVRPMFFSRQAFITFCKLTPTKTMYTQQMPNW
nr:unnamed protein product [Callosobruchus chinensis]